MSRSSVWTGVGLAVLAFAPGACVVSSSTFEEKTAALEADLLEERQRTAALEGAVSELLALREDSAEAARIRGLFADRLDRMESERTRLEAVESGLADQQARLATLLRDIEELRRFPPMERIVRIDQDLADLEARVAVDARMTASNRDTLEKTMLRLNQHVAEFERQMRLLGDYVEDQFVPLAEGLVKHLYDESARLQENAQGLGEFARRVDPFKFKHLQPGYTEAQPPPAKSSGDD